ncbi:MAG: helix-hairpin-helix domain-containing protein [Gemmatimonadetes bacterium]|nr:helix-hairpin-helix domain-containing protein [Gemmatimonadota bacterium]
MPATKSELQEIPGVGPSIAQDLEDLGIEKVSNLRGRDPQRMYDEHCQQKGVQVDRCVLYVFRCAVYYVNNTVHDPELLKWWNWKDRER